MKHFILAALLVAQSTVAHASTTYGFYFDAKFLLQTVEMVENQNTGEQIGDVAVTPASNPFNLAGGPFDAIRDGKLRTGHILFSNEFLNQDVETTVACNIGRFDCSFSGKLSYLFTDIRPDRNDTIDFDLIQADSSFFRFRLSPIGGNLLISQPHEVFGTSVGGESYTGTSKSYLFDVSVHPVPLASSGLMLLSAIGLFGLRRRL